jgi:NAD(P)-dependent dehydrogenase (short-subunit alcohol dehydrogenase family)
MGASAVGLDMNVLITGGSRGLGAAVARRFAAAGAHVTICARDEEALHEVAADVVEAGGEATTQRADVRDEFDVERVAETAAREGGPLDVVFANAGVYHGDPGDTPISEESYATFDDHLRTNGRGVFATVRESVPHLADDARVLVPSGSIARDPKPGLGSYAVSKALSEALARQFAAELDATVGVVDPGQLSTKLTGDGPGRDPEEVADMFHWAAVEAPAGDLDGEVLDLRAWKKATR